MFDDCTNLENTVKHNGAFGKIRCAGIISTFAVKNYK